METLAEAGVPVFLGAPETVEGAVQMLGNLARRVEAPRAAEVLAPIERVVKRLKMRRGSPRRVFVPIWKSPYMGVGSDTYVHDVLKVPAGRTSWRGDPLPCSHAAGDRGSTPEIILLAAGTEPDETPARRRRGAEPRVKGAVEPRLLG